MINSKKEVIRKPHNFFHKKEEKRYFLAMVEDMEHQVI